MISDDDARRASTTLKRWALDEELKEGALASPMFRALAARVARRYISGDSADDAIEAARAVVTRGHNVSIEFVGESVRDASAAEAATKAFVEVATAIADTGLPSTVSFDLTHIGALIDVELAEANARRIADALPVDALPAGGTTLMVSAEGSDRTDMVLDLYERLAADVPGIGITLQASLHRTPGDLDRVLRLPGTIRLVKGAFLESASTAHARGSAELTAAYLQLARTALAAGHALNLASHDPDLVQALIAEHGDDLRRDSVQFEMRSGLGTTLLDGLNAEGYNTREYVLFGTEWWLYVLNRIAEHPERLILALADLGEQ
ncbi:proline dehydrogenase family protein [Subtercola lobariae]|uniref:Proline dehydrogenase 2 n=1 Tax=Subtercola lobariae TaxID=1588641 RepID=A0A917EZ96_9MICO|nr:proline dehydrogenase family protein [Subtercola lobariae]GGF33052.1 proline dehydrogenase 2 [Subtercola lobariae]